MPDNPHLAETGALRRGLRILSALRRAAPGALKPSEISRLSGIPRPSVYRLLEVLVSECAVQTSADGKHYTIAADPSAQGDDMHASIAASLRPMLCQVAARAASSAFLIQRAGDDSLCLERVPFGSPTSIAPMPVGGRLPFGVGAASLALLATYSDDEVEGILERVAPRLYAHARLSTNTVRHLVKQTRIRGYSVIGNYAVPGLLGVGRAVVGRPGMPAVAIAVSSTIERMNLREQRRIADILSEEGATIAAGRAPQAVN
jgi:DNA-binding IclR family transcriptional regulator